MKTQSRLAAINIGKLRRIVGHFGGHLQPYKTKLLWSLITLLGASAMTLLRPWPLKLVFDYALLPAKSGAKTSFLGFLASWDPFSVAIFAAGAAIMLAVVGGLLEYSQEITTKTVGHGVTAAIRQQLFSHIQRLPQRYHDYRETGELMTRLTGDINLVQDLLVETLIQMLGQLVIIAGMLVIALLLDWQLTLLILAVMPLFFLATMRFSLRIKKATNRQREKFGKLAALMEETLAGLTQIKIFRQEKQRDKLIGKSVGRDYKAGLKVAKLSATYARVVEIISAIGIGLVLLVGVKKAIAGSITAGDLIIFVSYVRGIYRPIRVASRLSTRIAKAIVRGEKLMDTLEIPPEIARAEGAVSAREIIGDIRFEHVKFAYVDDSYVFTDLTCAIPPLKATAVVGRTGAGKSTMAKLLLRLYEPESGTIWVDGRNIRDYELTSLRKRVTSLSQETFLFRTTIRDNISFGKPKATDEEIEQAVKVAGATEFIARLPQGFDTLVGEGGLTLSGGQRQRISIARAALKNSPVMIFDEPVTGLDIRAEEQAMQAISALKPGRTIVMITHRLSFLDLADWVIFVGDNCIEQGTLEELLERKAEFYRFVESEIGQSVRRSAVSEILPEGVSRRG